MAAFKMPRRYSADYWQIEHGLRPLVFDSGSLTAHLRRLNHDAPLRVRILREGRGYPGADEARALNIAAWRRVHVREVILAGVEAPWVVARTLIPPKTFAGAGRRLRTLGSRPLGNALFGRTRLTRSPIRFFRSSCAAVPHAEETQVAAALAGAASVWGRCSVFYLADRPLLVSEWFLPPLAITVEDSAADGETGYG